MTDYTELVKALLSASTVSTAWEKLMLDAAAAIEDMAKHITEMHERVTVLQIARGKLEAEVERLKDANDELREAQTYIDNYGDKWMTSAKDVPTSAYNHGYMDGKGEAEAAQPHWVKCDEALPEIGQRVIVYDGWMQFMTRKDDQRLNGKMYWENEEGNWERVDDEAYWMPIEPPEEDA